MVTVTVGEAFCDLVVLNESASRANSVHLRYV